MQIGFKIFLNITPVVTSWSADNKQFSLIFEENPLADFVELPDDGKAQDELWFSNILCGILRGALEMVSPLPSLRVSFIVRSVSSWLGSKTSKQVQTQVEAHFVSDILRGDETTEIRVTLLKYMEDELPPDDE